MSLYMFTGHNQSSPTKNIEAPMVPVVSAPHTVIRNRTKTLCDGGNVWCYDNYCRQKVKFKLYTRFYGHDTYKLHYQKLM